MSLFHYYHPIEVRYSDIDAQGHVNNACFLTYMEQARVGYLMKLRLWDGQSYFDTGIILADVQVTFKSPITLVQPIRVGARVVKLGNKSIVMEYSVEDSVTQLELAAGVTTLVAFDYRTRQTISVPETWRRVIETFEHSD